MLVIRSKLFNVINNYDRVIVANKIKLYYFMYLFQISDYYLYYLLSQYVILRNNAPVNLII